MDRKVVITGYGVISPFGYGEKPILENVFKGLHGFKKIASFDTSKSHTQQGAEAPLEQRNYRHFGRYCTDAALKMAHLDRVKDAHLLRNAYVAVGNLGDGSIAKGYYARKLGYNEWNADPIESQNLSTEDRNPFMQAQYVADDIGSSNPAIAFTNACVASANAIGYGYDQIRMGRTETALVGGINVLIPMAFYNFDSGRAMSTSIVRPFSKGREGLLIGDGAAILVLESEEQALKRGASIIAELAGWGISSDGFHVTQPHPEGDGLARAMNIALKKSGYSVEQIDYINAHGTGTPLNDKCETAALRQVLGNKTYDIPVSSTKSTTGHMLEATGAVEAVISLLALKEQCIPPTANYIEPDENMDLDYVTEGPRKAHLSTVMSNSSAFGGNNCTLIFHKGEYSHG